MLFFRSRHRDRDGDGAFGSAEFFFVLMAIYLFSAEFFFVIMAIYLFFIFFFFLKSFSFLCVFHFRTHFLFFFGFLFVFYFLNHIIIIIMFAGARLRGRLRERRRSFVTVLLISIRCLINYNNNKHTSINQ